MSNLINNHNTHTAHLLPLEWIVPRYKVGWPSGIVQVFNDGHLTESYAQKPSETSSHETYVIGIAWQSVLYGLYSPRGQGDCVIRSAHDCHAILNIYTVAACARQ